MTFPVTHRKLSGRRRSSAARIAELVDSGAYAGARLRSATWWLALELRHVPPPRRCEPSRVRHSRFDAGSIGWSWETTLGDGRGEFFITRDRQDGLDSAHQVIGHVAGGLAALPAIPAEPARRGKGQSAEPLLVDSIGRCSGMSAA
ncbi:MAG: peptidylprolyl isomerase [Devosia sp.]|nr:peptidylprolyl isomerase [Devosia sp.]